MSMIAENLEQINGITKVIYPQQMAEMLANWLTKIEVYGTLAIVIFFVLAFVMVYITFHLASYQRNRELKVKLYLGMNPNLGHAVFIRRTCVRAFRWHCSNRVNRCHVQYSICQNTAGNPVYWTSISHRSFYCCLHSVCCCSCN